MDMLYVYLISLFFVAVSFTMHILFFMSKPHVLGKLPPGPKGWPVVGESIEFLATGWKGHPEKFIFDRMENFSNQVFRTSLMLEDGGGSLKFEFLIEQTEIAKLKKPGELLNWEDLSKMKYSWNVACEVLRLTPPLQGAFREAITDFMYNGYLIPKGWKLYWSANSTHKNAEFFPEPQTFDPLRFDGKGPAPYTFVPFGGGPRMCPGKEYARIEILMFMHHLVRKFKWEKVIPDDKIVVNPMPNPANGLPIHLYPHQVSSK